MSDDEFESLADGSWKYEIESLRQQLEIERMRNVACDVVAMADTPTSAEEARKMLPEYRSAALESVIRRVDECIALRQQLVTLKTELKSIGEAIDDPRTDLTMTMSEVIVEQKQQLAAALEACKAKDDIILEVLECKSTTRPPIRLREALAIQPDDSALKDKAMTTYEQPKDWIERHLVEDPGGLLACEPSRLDTLNEELRLARQANEAQHQQLAAALAAIKVKDAFIEKVAKQTPEKLDYWSSCSQCGYNSSEAEDVLAATTDLDGLILCHAEPCRDDGRCQYAIDHGAEGLGHCPEGKCCMPLYRAKEPK